MSKHEELFESFMKEGMIQYNSQEFKSKYPTLRRTILKMIEHSRNEAIDEAAANAKLNVEGLVVSEYEIAAYDVHYTDTVVTVDTNSILQLKNR